MALVGNKSDNYQYEEVNDAEGKTLAKKINAVFQRTSAKKGTGINELFNRLGKRFLNPDCSITSNLTKEEKKKYDQQIKINEIKNKKKNQKKNCC